MAKHETIADIIAEMRQGMNPNGTAECQYLESDICMLADRLDAAHKRERGDAAKLREALKHIKDRLPHMLQYMRVYWEDASAGGYFDELMLVIDAALSAPPRNCDVYTSVELKVKFNSELASELPIANKHEKNLVAITAMGVIDTLFAPATEKEGGDK